jgi:hypothetical protein
MVVEISLMMQLVEEIKETLRADTDTIAGANDFQVCLLRLELLGMLSLYVGEWMEDPRKLLDELNTLLGKVSEKIPDWQRRVQEVIQMI